MFASIANGYKQSMIGMSSQDTRRSFIRKAAVTSGVGLMGLSGCTALLEDEGNVAVSSKNFEEHVTLAYMALETVEANTDVSVQDETRLGGTDQNWQALDSQEVDVYWEYTGTAWEIIPPQHEDMIFDPEELYNAVKQDFEEEHGHSFLTRSSLNNTYVLVVRPQWAEEHSIQTLSDFAAHVQDNPGDTTVVLDAEFRERSDGWPGVAEHYGFDDVRDEINTRNIETGVQYQVLDENEADASVGFNTDPQIEDFGLTVLEDDEDFFPVYNPAPLVNGDTIEEFPEIEEPLNQIGPAIDTETMRKLNKRAVIDEENPRDLAVEFLEDEGLI